MTGRPLPADDDFWGLPPSDRAPTFAEPAEPTALVESLGPPPLPGGPAALAAVYAEAARLAGLLARSAGLLTDEEL